jgi:hypothetical protein
MALLLELGIVVAKAEHDAELLRGLMLDSRVVIDQV